MKVKSSFRSLVQSTKLVSQWDDYNVTQGVEMEEYPFPNSNIPRHVIAFAVKEKKRFNRELGTNSNYDFFVFRNYYGPKPNDYTEEEIF